MHATIIHIIWFCEKLADFRKTYLGKIGEGISPEMLHGAMVYGIAPILKPFAHLSIWGSR